MIYKSGHFACCKNQEHHVTSRVKARFARTVIIGFPVSWMQTRNLPITVNNLRRLKSTIRTITRFSAWRFDDNVTAVRAEFSMHYQRRRPYDWQFDFVQNSSRCKQRQRIVYAVISCLWHQLRRYTHDVMGCH